MSIPQCSVRILALATIVLFGLVTQFQNLRSQTHTGAIISTVQQETSSTQLPDSSITNSNDFATRVLQDPWDMSEYTDVSQYLNESGQREYIRNMRVSNGIFSGTSVGDGPSGLNANFSLLFPGYHELMKVGKIGYNYPINSSEYRCFYAAMKIDSGAAIAGVGPDVWRVFWFADTTLNTSTSPWGLGMEVVYPEAGAAQPNHYWKLHEMKLDSPFIPAEDGWNRSDQWQGLRLDPTTQAGVDFAVDWVRLTDCNPNYETISFSPNGAVTAIWLKPVSGNEFIRIADDVAGSSGSYRLDTQGLQAGEYTVGFGNATTCCVGQSTATLSVNEPLTINFIAPSHTSGEDYATAAGNAWDFSDASDVTQVLNATATTENGLLNMVTASGDFPAGVDSQIHLNTPIPALLSKYRYLTIRMYTEWDSPWQDVVSGMIGRWIWTIPSLTGQQGYECHLVTQDIEHNVGWHTYKIDLHNYFNGAAEETSPHGGPHCPGLDHVDPQQPPIDPSVNASHWVNTGSATKFRFDPNENISCAYAQQTGRPYIPCSDYRQQIDWIALTAMDQVAQGDIYEIQLDINEMLDEDELDVYYTSTPSQPRQNIASMHVERTPSPTTPNQIPNASQAIYLPLTPLGISVPTRSDQTNAFEHAAANAVSFLWNTSGVSLGEYYICVEANDGTDSTTNCSDVPVQIVNP